MNDVRLRWSVFPWTHYRDGDPQGVPGAAIHDSRREVTYRATVDARGLLNHLEVELDGYISDAYLVRLRSIPRERIQETVAAFVKEDAPDTLHFVMEGGLLAGPAEKRRGPAVYEEVARLMATRGWGRQELAAFYFPDRDAQKAVRTVDGWIAAARKRHPDVAPRATTGKGYRPNKTTDGNEPSGN